MQPSHSVAVGCVTLYRLSFSKDYVRLTKSYLTTIDALAKPARRLAMLELYQFEMSHYAEKIRLILDYKELEYRKIEVTPGLGQMALVRLSGQRQVPVLKDGSQIIADSTAIAEYLERQYPEKPIIPTDPKLRGLTLLIEQWADESIGLNARKCLIGTFGQDAGFRTAVLPADTPDFLKTFIGSVPGDVFSALGYGVG